MTTSFPAVRRLTGPLLVAAALVSAGCSDSTVSGPQTFTPQAIPGVTNAALAAALASVDGSALNGGFNLPMWATVVDKNGVVVAVAHSGASSTGDQWLGSRAISAQKANTANAFSLTGLSVSTAVLYTATQPGGSLYGLQESNPVDVRVVYGGNTAQYGTVNDYMVGKKPGGINVFGGGLALYNAAGEMVGAVGVSGDTSCADHNIAWRLRHALGLDYSPGGPFPDGTEDIVYDISVDSNTGLGTSASGWGHPVCGFGEDAFNMNALVPLQ